MKKLFAALTLSVVLTPAWADWLPIGGSKHHDLYIRADVIKTGETVKGWVMLDGRLDGKEKNTSFVQLKEVRCNSGQKRVLQTIWYYGQLSTGEVMHKSNKAEEWIYPAPDSLDETIFRRLCSKR